MLHFLNDGEVKFLVANFILFLPVLCRGHKIFPSSNPRRFPVPRFCNQCLHPLDVNISHVEHDSPQLESTQETDSINSSKPSWSETNEKYR